MTLTWRTAHLVYQLFAELLSGLRRGGPAVLVTISTAGRTFQLPPAMRWTKTTYPNAAARTAIRAQYGITGT